MMPNDRVADLSSLYSVTDGDIDAGSGHRAIQSIFLDNPATTAPVCDLFGVPRGQGFRLGAHQVSSYSAPTAYSPSM